MENQIDYSENEVQPEEILETHSEAEENALLQELSGEDFNPDTAVQKSDPKKEAALAAGEATTKAVLGVTEQIIKQFAHKDFTFDTAQIDNVATAAAPLFVKYNGELPPWLAAYREELTFVVAAGALGFSSFTQIKALKAIDQAKDITPQEQDPQPQEA
ncbi:hypothetical protein [Vibrio quintilis]|uniref:Uncharacterized protein n=1 Tax=Vibrio quintilis TaxID=1117707 RepID=A0A1M7Z2U0_9VIBR|nr:hypothetical protein [Vibrio quintilis]SHO59132.1 hypothetical protein VQ7734_04909 [Vibrio quintilis]